MSIAPGSTKTLQEGEHHEEFSIIWPNRWSRRFE